ncbi:MAG: CotH kinase family protein, partial [Anaerohalosphaera sp.]|nr:CotH kinase family protein [Anaerohalosphaera sp.]
MRHFVFFAFMSLSGGFCFSACPLGDLDGDCSVGVADLEIFAGFWLDESNGSANLDGVGMVDMSDLAIIAKNWGQAGCSLAINEFMADNQQTIESPDEAGEFPDWVEIYNYGTKAIDLAGFYLSDDIDISNMWQVPSGYASETTIAVGGYLVIWADGKPAQGVLHADFKLDADGEEIVLFSPDGNLIESKVFGDQFADVSYGRTTDAGQQWHTLYPTPGATNQGSIQYMVSSPEFSVNGGAFTGNLNFGLYTDDPDAIIRYTLDGSEPSPSHGYAYSSPITIDNTKVIKAIAYKPGIAESEVVTKRFVKLDSSVSTFTSNLPVILIENFAAGSVPNEPKQEAYMMVFEPGLGRTSTVDSYTLDSRIGIERRGSSTLNQPKGNYGFEIWDEAGDDKSVSLLGMPSESDWILYGPYTIDRTLMRNSFMYELSNQIGRYAVRTRFVEVFFNKDGGDISYDDYVGVYVLMEKIKRDSERVDIEKLEDADNAMPEIAGGYILRHDRASSDSTFYTSRGVRLINEYPKLGKITSAQKNWIKNYTQTFENALYSTNYTDPST